MSDYYSTLKQLEARIEKLEKLQGERELTKEEQEQLQLLNELMDTELNKACDDLFDIDISDC